MATLPPWTVLLGLLCVVCMGFIAFRRKLLNDFARYLQTDDEWDDYILDTGWKNLHRDVYRSPSHPYLLAVIVANGLHLFWWIALSFILITLLPSVSLRDFELLYAFISIINGYYTAKLCYILHLDYANNRMSYLFYSILYLYQCVCVCHCTCVCVCVYTCRASDRRCARAIGACFFRMAHNN